MNLLPEFLSVHDVLKNTSQPQLHLELKLISSRVVTLLRGLHEIEELILSSNGSCILQCIEDEKLRGFELSIWDFF